MNIGEERMVLFSQVLAGMSLRKADSLETLFGPGMFFGTPLDDGYRMRWRSRTGAEFVAQWDEDASQAADRLIESLRTIVEIARRATQHDVLTEVLSEACRAHVREASARKALASLTSSVECRFPGGVVILPVGGLLWAGGPQRLGAKVAMGRISTAMENLVTELGHGVGITKAFAFHEDDVFNWTEDYLAYRDGGVDFELEGLTPHMPLLVAVAVDAVGWSGDFAAMHAVEAVLGAFWIAEQDRFERPIQPPWIFGANHLDLDDLESDSVALWVTSIRHTGGRPSYEYHESHGEPIAAEERLTGAFGSLIRGVAASLDDPPGAPSRRLAAACRRVLLGADRLDLAEWILAFVVGLEALVVTNEGSIRAEFARRVASLLTSSAALPEVETKLRQLYDVRSQIVHTGMSKESFQGILENAMFARKAFLRSALRLAERWQSGELRTEGDLDRLFGGD